MHLGRSTFQGYVPHSLLLSRSSLTRKRPGSEEEDLPAHFRASTDTQHPTGRTGRTTKHVLDFGAFLSDLIARFLLLQNTKYGYIPALALRIASSEWRQELAGAAGLGERKLLPPGTGSSPLFRQRRSAAIVDDRRPKLSTRMPARTEYD